MPRCARLNRDGLGHKKLDQAVFAAYGWKPDLSDEEILAKVLSLNWERSTEKGGEER
jgi:hypothetical protein